MQEPCLLPMLPQAYEAGFAFAFLFLPLLVFAWFPHGHIARRAVMIVWFAGWATIAILLRLRGQRVSINGSSVLPALLGVGIVVMTLIPEDHGLRPIIAVALGVAIVMIPLAVTAVIQHNVGKRGIESLARATINSDQRRREASPQCSTSVACMSAFADYGWHLAQPLSVELLLTDGSIIPTSRLSTAGVPKVRGDV